MYQFRSFALVFAFAPALAAAALAQSSLPVTMDNFVRAETDLYFKRFADDGGFGKLKHRREMAAIDKQDVVRMNCDTLYSSGVFDLDAGTVTVTLPNAVRRFMSMQVISQDHYTVEVVYPPGRYTYSRDKVGTRYVFINVRTLADPENPRDVQGANVVQNQIKIEQPRVGTFEVPNWDRASQDKVRAQLNKLSAERGGDLGVMFGKQGEVDPKAHLIGAAIGWGGNPPSAAMYQSVYPKLNDGKTAHRVTVKDVPVDGFWSVSVYNDKGYFEKNSLNAYSVNSLTGRANPNGSFTVHFGGCGKGVLNCLPVMAGWNYTVRLYRPRNNVVDGRWKFPDAEPVR